MTKGLLVSLTVLSLSASAALAAHPTHHRHAVNAHATVAPSPVDSMVGMGNNDHATYLKNLHDSGYNPKNDFDANGVIKTQ
jgi:hypothetical protein